MLWSKEPTSPLVHIRVYTVVDSKWLERNESTYLNVTLFVASRAEADKLRLLETTHKATHEWILCPVCATLDALS